MPNPTDNYEANTTPMTQDDNGDSYLNVLRHMAKAEERLAKILAERLLASEQRGENQSRYPRQLWMLTRDRANFFHEMANAEANRDD